MPNNIDKINNSEDSNKKVTKGLIFENIKTFLKELFDFRDNTDHNATIDAIKADIPFKGATAWILIFSIFVASIGLNVSSTAVVIGAMLISPLMGPIVGVGLSVAINDVETLRRSLINLGVMVVLSVLTAFLYFSISPLTEETPELLSRTYPTILDVLVAIFGGLALIVAKTKSGTIASVIFGVAIATALMPPLCVAGYGLANDWSAFVGAMYLFTINTIFIALATFLVLKILRFPMLKYANSKRRKRISQLASLIAILVMIWPMIKFIDFINETRMVNDYEKYMKNEVDSNTNLWLQRPVPDYDNKTLTLYFNDEITLATETDLRNELKNYEYISDFDLKIVGNKNRSIDKISDAYDRAIVELDRKDNIISGLHKEIDELQKNITGLNQQLEANTGKQDVAFSTLAKDAKIRFIDLDYFSFGKMLESRDFIKVDTLSVANIAWKSTLNDSLVLVKEKELYDWLKAVLKTEKIQIKRN